MALINFQRLHVSKYIFMTPNRFKGHLHFSNSTCWHPKGTSVSPRYLAISKGHLRLSNCIYWSQKDTYDSSIIPYRFKGHLCFSDSTYWLPRDTYVSSKTLIHLQKTPVVFQLHLLISKIHIDFPMMPTKFKRNLRFSNSAYWIPKDTSVSPRNLIHLQRTPTAFQLHLLISKGIDFTMTPAKFKRNLHFSSSAYCLLKDTCVSPRTLIHLQRTPEVFIGLQIAYLIFQ